LTHSGGASGPEGWSAADKFAAVVESAALNEAELGEYSRKRDRRAGGTDLVRARRMGW